MYVERRMGSQSNHVWAGTSQIENRGIVGLASSVLHPSPFEEAFRSHTHCSAVLIQARVQLKPRKTKAVPNMAPTDETENIDVKVLSNADDEFTSGKPLLVFDKLMQPLRYRICLNTLTVKGGNISTSTLHQMSRTISVFSRGRGT